MGEGDGAVPVKLELLAGISFTTSKILTFKLGFHTYTAKSECIREHLDWEYLKTHSCAVYFLGDDEDAALVGVFVVLWANPL